MDTYEKKYNEALNWMRELYPGLHGATKEDAEHYFPELRESEDEKIRRTLVEYFGPEAKLEFIRGVKIQKIRDWLEKQKENPQSADSIPSNCTSDAKCEDRWHKVTDSLPDNGREVLAKDKLGNTLLARYDGEGWDVSVYDDEDYRCHNGISKWCEIPSEKQKDHFRDDTKKVEKQDYSGLTDLERAIHRCFLSAGVENVPVTIIKETAKECLAQMKPAEQDYDNRIQYDSVKSGIEAFASTYSFNIESKLFPQLTKEQQRLWREEIEQAVIAGGEDGAELARDNRYKENRMIEWSEDDKSFYDSIMCEVIKEGMHPTPAQANWLKSLPERFNLQPKQEWSEEDERILYNVIAYVGYAAGERGVKDDDFKEANEWLRNLHSHPSWKPSKEQIDALLCAVNDSIMQYDYHGSPLKEKVTRTYSENLQSLYTQLKKLM